MSRMHHVLGIVVLAGCWSSPIRPGESIRVERHSDQPRADYSATIADPLGFLPADAAFVAAVDLVHLRKSAVWMQFEPAILEKISGHLRCPGRDPFATIESITLGFSSLETDKHVGTIVVRGLDRAGFTDCLKKSAVAKSLVFDGEMIVSHGTLDVVMQFVGRSTLVAAIGPHRTTRDLVEVLHAGAPLQASPSFAAVLAEVDISQGMWLVLNGHSKPLDSLAAMGMHPEAIFATLDAADFVSANLHVRMETAAFVAPFVTMVQTSVGAAKSFFDRFDVSAVDRDLVLDVAINAQQISQLLVIAGISTTP